MFTQWDRQRVAKKGDRGLFRHAVRMGTEKTAGQKYRDWSYEFISHQTGSSVIRKVYHVSVFDPYGLQITYLRDFSSLEKAAAGAREFIDQRIRRLAGFETPITLGSVPEPPENSQPEQESSDQQK